MREENPFHQTDLLSDECFILDHGKNKMLFVWKGNARARLSFDWWTTLTSCPTGHNANSDERKKAMRTAEDFIKDMNYAQNTQVSFNNRNRLQEK